jgi:hypothetical protein
MIQENGYDMKYLAKKPDKVKKRHLNTLSKAYMSILYTLDGLNNKLLYHYIVWQAHLTQLRAELLINKNAVIDNLEENFREYLYVLQKSYKNFEFKEYYYKNDNKEFVNKITEKIEDKKIIKDINRIFKDLEYIRFYTFDEYIIYVKNNKLIQKYDVIKVLLLSEIFKSQFILSRIKKFNNLVEVDTYLYDIYSEADLYYKYQYIRHDLFSMYNLNSESKTEFSAFDQVAGISDILGYQINTKKTTLAEWEALQNRATRKIEKNNKPNEA